MDMNTDSLSTIWNRQPVPQPVPAKELLRKAAGVRRRAYWRHGRSGLLLIATLIYIDVLLSYVPVQMVTTRIGVALMNIAIFVYLAASGDMIYLWIRPTRQDQTVSDHLQELLTLKQRQQWLFGRFFTIYYSLLTVGLFFYCLEFTLRMRVVYAVVTYVLLTCWVLVFWFWLRPRLIKKHADKVDLSIAELERLAGQLHVSS
jgi:hypothetical protein